MTGYPVFAQRAEPVAYRRYTASVGKVVPVSRDQSGRPVGVTRGQRVRDRLLRGPNFPVPGAGPPVQQGHEAGLRLRPG
jgi:hypothetical protein